MERKYFIEIRKKMVSSWGEITFNEYFLHENFSLEKEYTSDNGKIYK